MHACLGGLEGGRAVRRWQSVLRCPPPPPPLTPPLASAPRGAAAATGHRRRQRQQQQQQRGGAVCSRLALPRVGGTARLLYARALQVRGGGEGMGGWGRRVPRGCGACVLGRPAPPLAPTMRSMSHARAPTPQPQLLAHLERRDHGRIPDAEGAGAAAAGARGPQGAHHVRGARACLLACSSACSCPCVAALWNADPLLPSLLLSLTRLPPPLLPTPAPRAAR